VLFVTHDIREAFRFTDQLVFLTGAPARIAQDIRNPIAKADRSNDAAIEAARAHRRSYEPD
jgi:ABC-type nitrate/sulfonate/bicarbonate transport system ATPase subunit